MTGALCSAAKTQAWDSQIPFVEPLFVPQSSVDSADFTRQLFKEPVWLDGWCNPPWVYQDPTRSRLSHVGRKEEPSLSVRIVVLLKECGKQKDLGKGSKLHEYIKERKLLEKNSYIASALIIMYARCGALAKAQQVLDELPIPVRDVVTWNALITAYAQQGWGYEALKCFDKMQSEGHLPTEVTFICTLKACASIGATAKGEEIHDKIVSLGLLEKCIVLGSALVDMYAKCNALTKAQQVLDELPDRNVVSWNALIGGYTQQGQGQEALNCFNSMQHEGHSPDSVTFVCSLQACGLIGAAIKGKEIHDKIVILGILKEDTILGSALVDMYARCGALAEAQQVFNELPVRNAVAWTALTAGYAQWGEGAKALQCFDNMLCEGHSPDAATFTCALKACGSIGAAFKGEQIHDRIIRLGMLEKDIVLESTLVDMYAKCGALVNARKVFDKLPIRTVIVWTSLIAGYARQGEGEEALKCFDDMQCEGHSPDAATFTCVLRACGSIGATVRGEQIHEKIACLGLLEKNIVLGGTLIDMYARCGALAKAQLVFDELPVQNVIVWTALIAGYAQQGQSVETLMCFERMQSKRVRPDSSCLVCVLHACSHCGLLDQADVYFLTMSTKYSIIPDAEHYGCIVDLFGRSGKFGDALLVLQKMPSNDYLLFWLAILGACQKWVDVKIGRLAFKHAHSLDQSSSSAYVCMDNIFRTAGMKVGADVIEVMLED